MRFLIVISVLLSLFGCKSLMLNPNVLTQNNNQVTSGSLDLEISIDNEYKYLGQFEYQQFYEYSDAPGGSVHNGNVIVFENKDIHSFVAVEKKTCSSCAFYPSSSVSEEEGPASFFVGNKRFFKQNYSCFSMTPKYEGGKKLIELLMASGNTGYEGKFCSSSYVYGINNSYFKVMLAAPCNKDRKLDVNIKDVVLLRDI